MCIDVYDIFVCWHWPWAVPSVDLKDSNDEMSPKAPLKKNVIDEFKLVAMEILRCGWSNDLSQPAPV
jgi:hypothetical protein